MFLDSPGRDLSNEARGFPFWEKSEKSRPNPTQIPEYFGPFLTQWLDLVPARRSVLKKAARGWPRIRIWSHEGPNQSQNHVFARSRCQPVSHGFAHPASRKARLASGLEPRHVLRKQAVLFCSSKNTHPGKTPCQIDELWPKFCQFLVKI